MLVPAPFYGGFDVDLGLRAGVVRFPVHTDSKSGYALTVELLERSLAQAVQQGLRVRGLLLTSPHNPLGVVYSSAQLREYVDFASRHAVHLLVDEIYAMSVFDGAGNRVGDAGTSDDPSHAWPFTSVLALRGLPHDHVHVVWAFSKDFAASGFRMGMIVTRNAALARAAQQLSYFTSVGLPMQRLVRTLLSDDAWLQRYLQTNARRLREAHAYVRGRLQQLHIPHIRARAGLFVYADLRAYLAAPTLEAELQLWYDLIDKAKIYVNPGQATFHDQEPGWFRFIVSDVPEVLELAMDRLDAYLRAHPRHTVRRRWR